jgi:DNA-damage-inducible protein J
MYYCGIMYIERSVEYMTQVNFRIDEEVKADAEKALKDMGLNMSTAITMFLVKVGRERRIPFEINADPFYSADNMAELERRIASVKNGASTLKEHELIEVDEE